jgi:beta-galactosidase/beta-glucuronidase
VRDGYNAAAREVHRRIALSDPGIDDSRNTLLWSPEKPTLIRAEVELCRGDEVLDRVESYTALRSVSVRQGDFLLNGRPYYLRLVLDQGYWPESLMSPPTEAALRRDVELAKVMGFNGVRKHQKIEDPRYLYWADVLGLLVWEEMPSAYRFTHDGVERVTREWIEVLDRDYNHPCIVTWVPFNESWGVPDLPETAAHRNWVQSLYHLTKTLDPTRPVVGNDGWESSATDIIGIHDYDCDPQRMRERYDSRSPLAAILNRRSPAGRLLTVEGYAASNQPVMLTEFGGIAFATRGDPMKTVAWGYEVSESEGDLEKRYGELLAVVHSLKHFRGFCYTQFADTFQEANGLLFADRRPKLPLTELAAITRGCVHHGVIPEQPVLESGDGAECPR